MPLQLCPTPSADDFTALAEHEASTPATFFGGKPVLHVHARNCHVLLSQSCLNTHVTFASLRTSTANHGVNGNGDHTSNTATRIEDLVVIEGVEVFVTSESVILHSTAPSASDPRSLSIPYPAISLHATQRLSKITSSATPQYSTVSTAPTEENVSSEPADRSQISTLYLQIDPSYETRGFANPDVDDGNDEDAASQTVELFLIPAEIATGGTSTGEGSPSIASTKDIFDALSRCADLHPDELDDEEDGNAIGSLGDFGMPGQGGWITAENAHEFADQFQDADNDTVGELDGDGLGPGAGSRRARDNANDNLDANGDSEGHIEETKWQRTA